MKDCIIQARIEDKVKKNAEKVLNAMGLSISDGVRLFLNQVTVEKGLPFRPSTVREVNQVTQKVIEDADNDINVAKFGSKEALFEDLGI